MGIPDYKNKDTSFGPDGFLIARNNPDGTPISPNRILGFLGTIDLSGYTLDTAKLGIKIDTIQEVKDVDFSAAVDVTAVTVAEMVTAITTAAFTDITASVDPVTGRLLIVYSGAGTPKFFQVFSVSDDPDFAAKLDLGQGIKFGGFGAHYWACLDNTKTVNLPNNIKDAEDIEDESGDGTLINVRIAAKMKGINPDITTTDLDDILTQIIQGGTLDIDNSKYIPPLAAQAESPIFSLNIFSKQYGKGQNKREDYKSVKWLFIGSVTGLEGDKTEETKTFGNMTYNCQATEYENENNARQAVYTRQRITPDDYIALDIENIQPDFS